MNALACTVPFDSVIAPAMAHIHSAATLCIPDLRKLSFSTTSVNRLQERAEWTKEGLRGWEYECRFPSHDFSDTVAETHVADEGEVNDICHERF
jgi:hypothetical protein